jgi:hypothetical protein
VQRIRTLGPAEERHRFPARDEKSPGSNREV